MRKIEHIWLGGVEMAECMREIEQIGLETYIDNIGGLPAKKGEPSYNNR